MTETNLLYKLQPFYHQEIIDLKEHPDSIIREKVRNKRLTTFDFRGLEKPFRLEVKLYLQWTLAKDIKIESVYEYLMPMRHLIEFIKIKSRTHDELTLRYYSPELENDFKAYLDAIGVATTNFTTVKSNTLKIYKRMHMFVRDLYTGSNPFDNDIWHLEKLGIESKRLNESNVRNTISFCAINNELNRDLAKKFIKYQITTTDKAISTLYAKYKYIERLLVFLDAKSVYEMDRLDVENFIDSLNNRNLSTLSFNEYIYANIKFMDYLIVSGEISSNLFLIQDVKPVDKNHSYKAVDETVIKQIFSVLNQLPLKESAMFLLVYSTGMRVSEVCAIKSDSLFKNNNGSFIRFYSQKMRKEVVNPIPETLYELLTLQKQIVMDNPENKNNYLFPYYNFKCYPSSKFRKLIQQFCRDLRIKNPDGTLYQFKPHDYRHTLATTMILRDIPSTVIQKVLHHDSIEMTSAYIDIQDQQKIKKHKEFINIKGEAIPIAIESSMTLDDLAKVEWLKKSIHAQMLPNGMCSLPVAMGKCPHANSCLTCSEFRTSKEFLPVHQNHYQKVTNLLDYAKQQGWQRQVETNEEVKNNLATIIERLKKEMGVTS